MIWNETLRTSVHADQSSGFAEVLEEVEDGGLVERVPALHPVGIHLVGRGRFPRLAALYRLFVLLFIFVRYVSIFGQFIL